MDIVCCSCIQLRSKTDGKYSSNFSTDILSKYCVDNPKTRLVDGRMWVCRSCSSALEKDQEPERCQKEFLGLLDFPESFKSTLHTVCTPSPLMNSDPDKFIKLNRLEDFLLKIFIEIKVKSRIIYFLPITFIEKIILRKIKIIIT